MSTPTIPTDLSVCQPAAPFPDPIVGILPFGTVTIFAGAAGVGKTAMLAEWCRRWRDGLTICGKPTNTPTAFYYMAADRQWKSHQQWFDAVGFGDIPHYSIADDPAFSLDKLKNPQNALNCFLEAFNKLRDGRHAPEPGAHVFVDPVSPLYIAGDPNRARDVAGSLLRLSRVAQQYQVNLTCTAHFGKQKTDPKEQYTRPQDRIAGSGAFAGFSDTQIYLIDPVPPQQPYHILGWNPRHAPLEEFHFVRNTQGLFVPYELFAEMDREEKVLACVPVDPTPVSLIVHAIEKAIGMPVKTAERYLSQLVKAGRITKVRRGVYCQAKVC